MQTVNTIPLSPETPSFQVGLVAKRGGVISVDTPLTEYFKGLHIETGGDLLIKGVDNQIIPVLGVLSGSWIYAVGYEVVSAATIGGVPYTTTATGITWIGGF